MNKSYELIREYVDSLYIVDTHEHLPERCEHLENLKNLNPDWDILSEYLPHYMNCDLRSAGLSLKSLKQVTSDYDMSIIERWDMVEPYWNAARYTGYARALDIAVQDIYGLPGLNRNTIEEANEKFQASLGKNQYEKILKEKSKIIISILDRDNIDRDVPLCERGCDSRYFRSVFHLENFYYPKQWEEINRIETAFGITMHRFEDWLGACEESIDKAIAKGAIGFKTTMAYTRSLDIKRPSFHEAEETWNSFYSMKRMPDFSSKPLNATKAFQDYVIHFILSCLAKRDLPVQIHTGIQDGYGNFLDHTNPTLLCNLFLEYPDITFDVFHMGYPYQHELSALAKMFPNVFIDMCWAHVISPIAAQNALIEWIDAVPINKICAFGGDYLFVDGVYGHQVLARQNVSISLATKIEAGVFDVDEAKVIAKMLFVDNPANLFGLNNLVKEYN